ncbi:SDR family NAD(P)-dependent oxidoreductase [Chitinophaga sp.]|uniref:SDR family NAD(P)-dependent oxidoreductase n=1 Tax=Chitinophaga sp. TaxID=1869181 RepID=UPI0031DF77F9
MTTSEQYNGLEIAITGISAQFPQSADHREFWKHLAAGRELLTFYSREEQLAMGVPESLLQNEQYVPTGGGRVHDKDHFDHMFFGYTPDEAALMDPQIRLFHQHCWHALEDAGCTRAIEKRKIGLFAGASANTNWKIYTHSKAKNAAVDPLYLSMITSPNFIATIVAYKLNLRGPAVYVDSACSTSLTAVHLACRSLLTRECAIALAGAVSMRTEIRKGYLFQEGKISSSDGHCRAFDAAASGTASGEGAGIVVLKRLSDAIRDKDHIYAVIRATAVNNDGSHKAGYTTPGVRGQVDCITTAQKLANIPPQSITYVEAHGTGTRLGDPVEIRALNEAFGVGGKEKFCALGAVKTNIGHLDTAAGVAGLIKTSLCLAHRQLPPSLHFQTPNPEIDFAAGPFYVNTSLQPWKSRGQWPLRAGVSSFGIGGTNAHAVVEEAPPVPASDDGRPAKLICLSARTARSLERYIEKLSAFLSEKEQIQLADLCYTLQTGRNAFEYRLSATFRDHGQLRELLAGGTEHLPIARIREQRSTIVWMFPGQGSQYTGMGKELYMSEPVFRAQMDEGFALIETITGESYKPILFEDDTSGRIRNTFYAQPLLFLVEYSLAVLLRSLGIQPDYMIGHSIGEYVAASLSGVFSFEDALRLVIKRGQLMSLAETGAMLSVSLSEEEICIYLNDKVNLAAINAPGQVVLSGDTVSIHHIKTHLEGKGIPCVLLHTSHAFHSWMVAPVMDRFRKELEQVTFGKVSIPFLSNLTGMPANIAVCSADYWLQHMREPVRFLQGLETILSSASHPVFIEVGAGHSLMSLLRQSASSVAGVHLLRSAKEQPDDGMCFAASLGKLWCYGLPVDWDSYYQGQERYKVSLPGYAFEPVRFPTEVDPFVSGITGGLLDGLRSTTLKEWLYYPVWKRQRPLTPASAATSRCWLFFSCNAAFSDSLSAALLLKDADQAIITISAGDSYMQLSATSYIIHPGTREHYECLLESLSAQDYVVTDIIYSWGMDADKAPLQQNFFGLVYLVQSMLGHNLLKDRRFCIITNQLHHVTGTEHGDASQALLLGLANVLPQEYPVACVNIDIRLDEPVERLAAALIANNGTGDRIIALRHGYAWVQDYEKNQQEVTIHADPITPGGVYLITGGLGNAGYVLASYLLEKYNACVILIGRQPEALLKAESRRHYESLLQRSKKVVYVAADIADTLLLEQTVSMAEEQYGRINGVVHTAGITAEEYFEPVGEITPDKVLAMLHPKVGGVQSLYQVFAKRRPDFVWLSSSLSSVLGGLGFGAYAAANLYMDHFVQSIAAIHPYWKAVCLGGIAFSREDIQREDTSQRLRLKPEELCQLFNWSLTVEGGPVIIQTVGELSTLIHKVYAIKKTVYLDDGVQVEAGMQKTERPGLSTVYRVPATPTEFKLVELFERFFGIAGIGTADNFFELGGDSLKAMMLLKRINNELDLHLTLTDFLTNTSINTLGGKIDELLWLSRKGKMDNEIVI